MHRRDLTMPMLAENLALDEALLLEAEAGGPEVLRFWEWPNHAVVLGAGGKVAEEANIETCEAEGVPIVRRSSGGGTVLLGRGCLMYSLVLSYTRDPRLADLHASSRVILDRMVEALRPFADGVRWDGISDLVIGDRKFSGNAQQRKRGHLLHHGTLLYDFDLAAIPKYLAPPPRMPDYRRARPHGDFVMNFPATAESIRRAVAKAWNAHDALGGLPSERVEKLMKEKYGHSAWHRRR
ncbi:MAG: lipoate--protein ligase family protein [Gemmataceae bacterium]|nr:lipoate--protein ligase family protein [Gemmataceae bacterium]